jgi:tetratricopeptide (TPR) repeat protein
MPQNTIIILCLVCFIFTFAMPQPISCKTGESASHIPKTRQPQNRNTINGMVFDPSGQPVSDIYVELQNEYYSTVAREKTKTSGRFVFSGLGSGKFKIKVLSLGTNYLSHEEEIQLMSISRGDIQTPVNEYVEIRLRLDNRKVNTENGGAASSVFAQEVPEEARKLYEKGVKELEKQENSDLSSIKKAVEIFPTYFLALERLGIEYVKRKQYEAALPFLIKAVDVNNRSASVYFSLGLSAYHLKHFKEAGEAFRAVTILSPQLARGHLWYGTVLYQDGNFAGAEKSLLKAKELSKNLPIPEVHWQLAILYNRTKRNQQAINELETFLKLQPENAEKEEIKNLIAKLRGGNK